MAADVMRVPGPKGGFGQGRGSTRGSFRYHYPPDVSSMKYCCLGVFRKEYFRLITK